MLIPLATHGLPVNKFSQSKTSQLLSLGLVFGITGPSPTLGLEFAEAAYPLSRNQDQNQI